MQRISTRKICIKQGAATLACSLVRSLSIHVTCKMVSIDCALLAITESLGTRIYKFVRKTVDFSVSLHTNVGSNASNVDAA